MFRLKWIFAAVALLAILAVPVWYTVHGTGAIYYIAANGSDSNNGTSTSTPWLHAPGMTGCASNCSGHTPVSGDSFIFKGGDTWGAANWPWTWQWSGSAGNVIYIGVDQTWFTGGSWTRPLMSGTGGSVHKFLTFNNSAAYTKLDNFEWVDLVSTLSSPTTGDIFYINGFGPVANTNIEVLHNYFHAWTVSHDGQQGAVAVIWGGGTGSCASGAQDCTSSFHDNIVDGADNCTPPVGNGPPYCTMVGLYGGPTIIYNNYFGYMSNGVVVNWTAQVYNNTIEYIVQSADNGLDHENAFESNGDKQLLLYNNLMQHVHVGGIVDFQMAPAGGHTGYAFNNVLNDMDGVNMMQCYEGGNTGTCNWFNNTVEGGPDASNPSGGCGRNTGPTVSLLSNLMCITTGSIWNGSATKVTNLQISKAAANAAGYSTSQAFPFSPTMPSNPTVATGTNRAAYCTTIAAINMAAGIACMQDSSVGVAYNKTNHTITGTGRPSTNARPATANWDIGAYQYFGTAPPPPVPSRPVILGSLPSGTVGTSYSAGLTASGGTPPYTWSENPTVPVLTLAPSTGMLSGTPATPGTYALTFTVTDSLSQETSSSAQLVIGPAAPPPPPPPLNTFSASVTVPSFSVSAVSGSTVPNLTFGVSDTSPSISVFSIATSVPWLTVANPAPNDKNGNSSSIGVNISGLAAGSYPGKIVVTMPDQNGDTFPDSPISIPVSLIVTSVPLPAVVCTKSSTSATSETLKMVISNFPVGATITPGCPAVTH